VHDQAFYFGHGQRLFDQSGPELSAAHYELAAAFTLRAIKNSYCAWNEHELTGRCRCTGHRLFLLNTLHNWQHRPNTGTTHKQLCCKLSNRHAVKQQASRDICVVTMCSLCQGPSSRGCWHGLSATLRCSCPTPWTPWKPRNPCNCSAMYQKAAVADANGVYSCHSCGTTNTRTTHVT
jgi:hypothetical protein